MLYASGGVEASTISRVRSGWKKFKELLPLLRSRVSSYKIKGKLYTACFRTVMLYGSDVWPLKESDISRISQTGIQMVWWMCNISFRDRKSSAELRNRRSVTNTVDVLRQTTLIWFKYVIRMDIENPGSNCKFNEVDGHRETGRP